MQIILPMKKGIIAVLGLTLIIIACSKGGSTNGGGGGSVPLDCSTIANKAFAADVNPIIQNTCTANGCHNAGSINGPGGLTTYTQIFNARAQIRQAINSGTMPQGSTLPTEQRNMIICWIDGGAPNN